MSRGRAGRQDRRVKRLVRRACSTAAFALLATALAAPLLATARAQDDPEAGRPTAFIASGESYGGRVIGNTDPPQVIAEVLNVRSPWTTAAFEAGSTSTSVASLFDPGAGATAGPSLLCQVSAQICAIPNFPPPYPLTAKASNPLAVDATAQLNGDTISIGPVQTTGGDARAHAGRDQVTATSTVQGNNVGSGGASLVRVGSSTASNQLSFAGDGSIVSQSLAAVNDINVLGALHIDSIEARSTSTAHLDGTLDNDVHLDITGASMGGAPVAIDDKGVDVSGNAQGGGLLGGLGTTVTPLLSLFRGTVRSLGTTDMQDATGATASANGVLVELFPNTDALAGVSPKISMLLAFAGSHAYLFNASPAPSRSSSNSSTGGNSSGGSSSAGASTPGRAGTPSVVIPGTAGTSATGSNGNTVEEIVSSLLSGSAADRMKFFYLAWTLSMIGCALGSRIRPARLNALHTTGGPDVQSP